MKIISSVIESDIPQFIRMDYPKFVEFIKAYYSWAEQEGQAYEFIANMPDYNNVDRTTLDLLEHFASVYLSPLPDIIYSQNNLSTLIKNITQHYSAKGSEKSIEFLFRLINNEATEFYYPSYDMLRVSHGKWSLFKSLKIIDPSDDVLDWESSEIVGNDSGARAIIDFISQYESSSGTVIAEIFLQELDVMHTISDFIIGETFTGTTYDGVNFTGTIEPIFGGLTITDAGKYYRKGMRIFVDDTNGEDSNVIIDTITKGEVESVDIVHAGTGYEIDDKLIFSADGFGTGAYGRVSAVGGSGEITAVDLTFGGHDYTSMPSVTIMSENGADGLVMSMSDSIGSITGYEIRDFGIDYEDGDDITTPLMMRVYDTFAEFEIGEIVTSSSGGMGYIESFERTGGIMGIWDFLGTFLVGDTITGDRNAATAVIYDTSKATIDFELGPVCMYKGRYINRDGHISSTKYLQDSYFYQLFSYMIKTFEKRDTWFDYIHPVHPAGMIAFGYREVPNKHKLNVSYGGFFGPTLDATELYRFDWLRGDTEIKQYADIVIDLVANINTNERDKTAFCFGSTITIT